MGRVGRDRYRRACLSSISVTAVEVIIYTVSVMMLVVSDWWLIDSCMAVSSREVAGALGIVAILMVVMTVAIAVIDVMAIVDLVNMVRRRKGRGVW